MYFQFFRAGKAEKKVKVLNNIEARQLDNPIITSETLRTSSVMKEEKAIECFHIQLFQERLSETLRMD